MSTTQGQYEKRRHTRYETMEYALLFPNGAPDPVSGIVLDISIGGLRFESRTNFEEGTVLLMQIGQGGELPIMTSVEVRYCGIDRETGLYSVGVKFMPGASENRMRVVKYIHDHFLANNDLKSA